MASRGAVDSSADDFRQLSLSQFLATDSRPIFVFDGRSEKPPPLASNLPSQAIFANEAFRTYQQSTYGERFANDRANGDNLGTKWSQWIEHAGNGSIYTADGILWHLSLYQNRWRVYTGTQTTCHQRNGQAVAKGRKNEIDTAYESGCISESHYQLLCNVDWSTTAYGHPDTWSSELRHTVAIALTTPEPCCVNWGPGRDLLYNESYTALIGSFHPAALGRSAKVEFASFWPFFEDLMLAVERTGQTQGHENSPVKLRRSNVGMEEAFFSYRFIPIKDSQGQFLGVCNAAREVTDHIVSERRLANLLKTKEVTSSATPLGSFWRSILRSFRVEGTEVPFAAVYSRGAPLKSQELNKDRPVRGDEALVCEGSIGWHEYASLLPAAVDLSINSGLARAIKASMNTADSPVLRTEELLKSHLARLSDTVPKSEESRVIVVPIQISSMNCAAWVIIGIQTLRPYDDDYRKFINLLKRQIETGATSLVTLEEERKGMEVTVERAQLEKQRLSKELAKQKREAEEAAVRFLDFAKHAPVGVYTFGPEGQILFANEAWYRLFGIPYKSQGDQLWRSFIHPADLGAVDEKWQMLANHGTNHAQFEFRVRRNPMTGSVDQDDDCGYLSSSCFAELSEDGTLKSVTGVIVDNTIHRAHEREAATRLADALEAKRAQENFMDMVSHEMRNPLNAIIQCAEEASQLIEPHVNGDTGKTLNDEAAATLEAINTILYCGHHQKQIIDDVLTISKLDSNLLTLAPTRAKPIAIAHQAVQIYNSEIRASEIKVTFDERESFTDGDILMDAGRVLQVLINLIGNAVKFLKGRPHRRLRINTANSTTRPPSVEVSYYPSGQRRKDLSKTSKWKNHKAVYAYFSIIDTGPGMTPEESNKLFGRFKQASPRTHTQYGGSGLGLFISRELAELHGGEIGLKSAPQEGSTFAFYVQGFIPAKSRDESPSTPKRTKGGSSSPNSSRLEIKDLTTFSPSPTPTDDPMEAVEPDRNRTVTVLIVEDNQINQSVLVRQLRKAGFQTETADNGEEALSQLRRSSLWKKHDDSETIDISLVLCDLEMPVMDGLTCVKQVRDLQKEGLLAHVPMIAVTGNARQEQVDTAKEAGFDDVVCKPYSISKLVPLINNAAIQPRE